jgi:hypothetical protein
MSESASVKELLLRIKNGDEKARDELFSRLGDEKRFGRVLLAMARKLRPRDHGARRLVETRDVVQSARLATAGEEVPERGDRVRDADRAVVVRVAAQEEIRGPGALSCARAASIALWISREIFLSGHSDGSLLAYETLSTWRRTASKFRPTDSSAEAISSIALAKASAATIRVPGSQLPA